MIIWVMIFCILSNTSLSSGRVILCGDIVGSGNMNGDFASELRSEFIDGLNDRSLACILCFCVSN
jgi:hypothetical protein